MTRAMHRVLVIEGDAGTRHDLHLLLTAANYRVAAAETASRGEIEARRQKPDLLIANLELPDRDGIELFARVRAWSAVPLMALSSHTSETRRVAALDAGADDCITLPFGAAELLARVRALLRRAATGSLRSWKIQLGEHVIDLARREMYGVSAQIRLTPLEFRLLENLARQSGSIIRQDRLIRQVWGPAQLGDTRGLRVCIRNLRSKLEPDARRPRYLVTERGIGYRLRVDVARVP